MFVYKILNNQAPMYLTLLIDLYVPGRTGLRSANPDLLLLQRNDTNVTNKTYGWRAFNICALLYGINYLWNYANQKAFIFLNEIQTFLRNVSLDLLTILIHVKYILVN